MKLTIERDALLAATGRARNFVAGRETIPILKQILLNAEGDGLELTTTDLDTAWRETAAAVIEEPGAVCVEARKLHDIARAAPGGAQIGMACTPPGADLQAARERGDGVLVVSAGRSRFKLATLPAEDFPEAAMVNPGAEGRPIRFALTAGDMVRLLSRVQLAISSEETRHYLCGAFLTQRDERFVCAATDGHKLGEAAQPAPEGLAGLADLDGGGVILPAVTVARIMPLLRDLDAAVAIAIELGPASVRFEFTATDDRAGAALASKLIDGTFPDYERVIPRQNDMALEVDAKEFAAAIGRAALLAGADNMPKQTDFGGSLLLTMEMDTLDLRGKNQFGEESSDSLSCTWNGPPGKKAAYSRRYLGEVCNWARGDTLTLRLGEGEAPTLIQDGDEDALLVLMPMRVPEA